jgi:16S rRNA (guanine966-N2)-methyltransferase
LDWLPYEALVRITGGVSRGRTLLSPSGPATRPMLERVRQSLFNILEHRDLGVDRPDAVRSATVLDPFCGSGALALEALSRGAQLAVMSDISPQAIQAARTNAEALGFIRRCRIAMANACSPPPATMACNLVFLAPPYHLGLVIPSLHALRAQGWFAEGVLIVAHTGADEQVEPGSDYRLVHERVYGDSRLFFIVPIGDARRPVVTASA